MKQFLSYRADKIKWHIYSFQFQLAILQKYKQSRLNLWMTVKVQIPVTPKCILWQFYSEDPDEMHFIRAPVTPRYIQCIIQSLFDQIRRKNPLVYKELNKLTYHIQPSHSRWLQLNFSGICSSRPQSYSGIHRHPYSGNCWHFHRTRSKQTSHILGSWRWMPTSFLGLHISLEKI